MNRILLDEAEKNGAQLVFEHSVVNVDFEENVAHFKENDGENLLETPFDLCIGAGNIFLPSAML